MYSDNSNKKKKKKKSETIENSLTFRKELWERERCEGEKRISGGSEGGLYMLYYIHDVYGSTLIF